MTKRMFITILKRPKFCDISMNPKRFPFLAGLSQHYVLLFGFKHDGQGLPSKGSSLVIGLMALSMLLSGVIGLLNPEVSGQHLVEGLVLKTLWLAAFYLFISIPLKYVEVLVGAMMLSIVGLAVDVVIGLLGMQVQLAPLSIVLGVWVLAAEICLLRRHTVRTVLSKKA